MSQLSTLVLTIVAFAPQAYAFSAQSCLASLVQSRTPPGIPVVEADGSYHAVADKVWIYTRTDDAPESHSTTHEYSFGGTITDKISSSVKSPRYFFTSKSLASNRVGRWQVRVLDAKGTVGESLAFDVEAEGEGYRIRPVAPLAACVPTATAAAEIPPPPSPDAPPPPTATPAEDGLVQAPAETSPTSPAPEVPEAPEAPYVPVGVDISALFGIAKAGGTLASHVNSTKMMGLGLRYGFDALDSRWRLGVEARRASFDASTTELEASLDVTEVDLGLDYIVELGSTIRPFITLRAGQVLWKTSFTGRVTDVTQSNRGSALATAAGAGVDLPVWTLVSATVQVRYERIAGDLAGSMIEGLVALNLGF